MNNKGFAITTILYGILILFCLLLLSMLGILSTYRNNIEKLIGKQQGAREIIGVNSSGEIIGDKEPLIGEFDTISK